MIRILQRAQVEVISPERAAGLVFALQ
jgi:hypothetical protein